MLEPSSLGEEQTLNLNLLTDYNPPNNILAESEAERWMDYETMTPWGQMCQKAPHPFYI